MTVKSLTVTSIAALAAAAVAAPLPAAAESWGEKIEMCAFAAEEEGVVDLNEYEPQFDGGTSRRVSLVFDHNRGEDVINVECRISRGRVVSIDVVS